MLLALAVLFVALSPGVLFRIPPLGKNMGGQFSSVVLHAIVFVIAVNLLLVVQEGFQDSKKAPPMKQVIQKVADVGNTLKEEAKKASTNAGATVSSILNLGRTAKK